MPSGERGDEVVDGQRCGPRAERDRQGALRRHAPTTMTGSPSSRTASRGRRGDLADEPSAGLGEQRAWCRPRPSPRRRGRRSRRGRRRTPSRPGRRPGRPRSGRGSRGPGRGGSRRGPPGSATGAPGSGGGHHGLGARREDPVSARVAPPSSGAVRPTSTSEVARLLQVHRHARGGVGHLADRADQERRRDGEASAVVRCTRC